MLWETSDHSANRATLEYTMEPKEIENVFLPYDILTNLAHVTMLFEQDFISQEELDELKAALVDLYYADRDIDGEDVHSFIEEEVTRQTEAGKKMHIGRSRNDQVFVDTRLFMKDATIDIAGELLDFVETLRRFADKKNMLIPGYTHQQQAMPSSTGLWASSYVDTLVDDLKSLRSSYEIFDANPLGAAASYGTSLDIDRDRTTKLLGFAQKQYNPIYCAHRGKQELQLLQVLDLVMLDIQKLSEDIINFSEDQQIFELPEEYSTGSSIMPQKKNPDILELARAKAEEVSSQRSAIRRIIAKLPSGYNRDTQRTKKHLIEAIGTVRETITILNLVMDALELSEEFDIKDSIFATYTVNQQVQEGVPFRDAYLAVKSESDYVKHDDIAPPTHQPFEGEREFWEDQRDRFNRVEERLIR
jgi:argininosuccinate lyase